MKIKRTLIVLMLAAALLGCGKREPRHIVILPDVSASIERESLEQAFDAIEELAGHLDRGDSLAVIPILSDAHAEASGQIFRAEVPTHRGAYDGDLRNFRVKLRISLQQMESNAFKRPGAKTDIFGSIELASQEFHLTDNEGQRTLIILSDFIQEDQNMNFVNEKQLRSRISAKELAGRIANGSPVDFQRTQVILGLLRSTEYVAMANVKRDAIKEFWIEYFRCTNAHPKFVIDGLGLIGTYLHRD